MRKFPSESTSCASSCRMPYVSNVCSYDAVSIDARWNLTAQYACQSCAAFLPSCRDQIPCDPLKEMKTGANFFPRFFRYGIRYAGRFETLAELLFRNRCYFIGHSIRTVLMNVNRGNSARWSRSILRRYFPKGMIKDILLRQALSSLTTLLTDTTLSPPPGPQTHRAQLVAPEVSSRRTPILWT